MGKIYREMSVYDPHSHVTDDKASFLGKGLLGSSPGPWSSYQRGHGCIRTIARQLGLQPGLSSSPDPDTD